jgi:cytochrome c peroxidase
MSKYIFTIIVGIAFLLLSGLTAAPPASAQLTNIELLGKYVFFDKISSPSRMACVTCHQPDTGGTGGVSGVNLHQVAITGANPHTIGNLKPPTNAYASFIKPFKFDISSCGFPTLYCGGNFWNGRAEGRGLGDVPPGALFPGSATKHIGDEIFYDSDGNSLTGVQQYGVDYFGPTADQALNPMPNLVEQNIDRQAVCNHVANAKYAKLYKDVWGVDIDCSNTTPVAVQAPDVDAPEYPFDISFKRIMLAVCAWQHSTDLNSFSSKRDIALDNEQDKQFPLRGFTAQENLGHDLFYGKAGCTACHLSDRAHPDGTGLEERYTDDSYHNIGVPPNPEILENLDPTDPRTQGLDLGLAARTGCVGTDTDPCPTIFVPIPGTPIIIPINPDHRGTHKNPTLRNVDKRTGKGFIKAYTHNGWFKSLESIVHFYNTAAIGLPTANSFGVTRCDPSVTWTEKDALANNCWPAPAYTTGSIAIPAVVGNLGLTKEEEAAIVAYLKTFTDTYTPKQPKPYK